MLDASRIDFGHERLSCEEFDLNEIFDDLRHELVGGAAVTVQWSALEDLPLLRTDQTSARWCAIWSRTRKYTERGFIRATSR
jgi:hypothetical protein